MAIHYLEYFHLNLVNYNIFGKRIKIISHILQSKSILEEINSLIPI